jgi:hypothetical protein
MNRSDRARQSIAVLAALAGLTAGCGAGGQTPTGATASRQAQVAAAGASVMPFDLERTTHRFAKNDTGGVQSVVADDPADTGQIALIRRHLGAEAQRFARGDFTDPARIHGDDMPGLSALRMAEGRVAAHYTDTADGATITYTTTDAALVSALHAWFDAQVSDHGPHATHG